MQVTFNPPTVAQTITPIRFTGPGLLDLRPEGIFVAASRITGRERGLQLLLGIVVLIVIAATLTIMGLSRVWAVGITCVIAVALLRPVLHAPVEVGEPVEQLFPWPNIERVTWDSASACMVVVVQGMQPKGGLYVQQPPGSPLQASIEARLPRR